MSQFLQNLSVFNSTRWQWRKLRWERRWKNALRGQFDLEGVSIARVLLFTNLILFTLMVLHGMLAGLGPKVLFSPPTNLLLVWGGQYWPAVLGQGQWWRCLTYAFAHGGLIHLAFNMLVLYQIGPLVEGELRPARFIILYTFATLTATWAALVWYPRAPIVGASGALFGLIGFAAVYYHRLGPAGTRLRNMMLQWAIIALIFGFVVGADNAGHLGGALGGALLGLVFPPYRVHRPGVERLTGLLALCCLLAMTGAILNMLWWIVTAPN